MRGRSSGPSIAALHEQIAAAKSADWDVKVLQETFPEVPVPIFKYLLQREDTLENVIKFLKGRGWKAQKSVSSDKHTLTLSYHGIYGNDTAGRLSRAQPHTYIVTFERGTGYRVCFRDGKGKLQSIKLGVGEGPEVPAHVVKKYKLSDGIPRPLTRLVCSRCGFTPCKLRDTGAKSSSGTGTPRSPRSSSSKSKRDRLSDRRCSMPLMGSFKDTALPSGHSEEVVPYPLYIPSKAELATLVVAHTQTVFV